MSFVFQFNLMFNKVIQNTYLLLVPFVDLLACYQAYVFFVLIFLHFVNTAVTIGYYQYSYSQLLSLLTRYYTEQSGNKIRRYSTGNYSSCRLDDAIIQRNKCRAVSTVFLLFKVGLSTKNLPISSPIGHCWTTAEGDGACCLAVHLQCCILKLVTMPIAKELRINADEKVW